ncbi:MAG: hypothetical protein IV086_08040 [Hyphomonadaceae bacterium]|nr:hypothetical protein [Hyphomonadaceae bacterium]
MQSETRQLALARDSPKGDARAVSEVAGVMWGKRTDLWPSGRTLPLTYRSNGRGNPNPEIPPNWQIAGRERTFAVADATGSFSP